MSASRHGESPFSPAHGQLDPSAVTYLSEREARLRASFAFWRGVVISGLVYLLARHVDLLC